MRFTLYCLLVSILFATLQLIAVFIAFQCHNENMRKANLLRALGLFLFFSGIGLAFYLFIDYQLLAKMGLCVLCYLLGRVIFQVSFTIYMKHVINFDEGRMKTEEEIAEEIESNKEREV